MSQLAPFLQKAWADHAHHASEVADRLPSALALVTQESEVAALAQLITHVLGEHLARWPQAIELLRQIPFAQQGEASASVARSIRALELAAGLRSNTADLPRTEQIRVLSTAAAALCGQGQALRAQELFREALELAQLGIPKEDPANRALAVTGNNLALTLEEKAGRSAEETELMLLASESARRYWEVAGTWLHVQRAEYRLAQSYRHAGKLAEASLHAQACLEICEANQAAPLELVFGYEALATVEKLRGNSVGFSLALTRAREALARVSPEEKSWGEEALAKLDKM